MGSGKMTPAVWAKYKTAIDAYSQTVSSEDITWHRLSANVDRWMEGMEENFEIVNFVSLVAYNTFRTWPVDSRTETGIIDKEYCHLYLNLTYLEENGWLTADKQFDFNPGFDRFWINGLEYKPAGDTGAAQANINPLFQILILEREEFKTGDKQRP